VKQGKKAFKQLLIMPHLNTIKPKELLPGFLGKFIHGKESTLTIWEIKKGSVLPQHHHVHEQITFILEGELQMTIGSETKLLTAGDAHVILSNVPHSAVAITDCKVVDSFSPARTEYQNDT
jgi:quercetin dioxygenase-like cupin family protein